MAKYIASTSLKTILPSQLEADSPVTTLLADSLSGNQGLIVSKNKARQICNDRYDVPRVLPITDVQSTIAIYCVPYVSGFFGAGKLRIMATAIVDLTIWTSPVLSLTPPTTATHYNLLGDSGYHWVDIATAIDGGANYYLCLSAITTSTANIYIRHISFWEEI